MTETLLVAGTASHVGKSTVVAGLCRRLARQGVSVVPYKAQNMSNNARAVVTPDGVAGAKRRLSEGRDASLADWGEIGVSQYSQARAANVAPTTDMNPVLLKPRGDGESQLVIQGEAVGHHSARAYYDDHWERARGAAVESYERLAAAYDFIVAEGAGSIAEINLHDRDLANVETARFADASILLLGDIERGGVFASLYGTLSLIPEDLRDRMLGYVITKFRGDESLLDPGIADLEDRTGVPVLGVLPYDDPGLPAEDSLSLPAAGKSAIFGDGDDVQAGRTVTIGVLRLPHISNFTDLEPLARIPGVRVRYVPPSATLTGVDAVVLPGTKNTVDDLMTLRSVGFDDAIADFSGPIVGICGGYQMLGERITNATVESSSNTDVVDGFDCLPIETRFTPDKRIRRTSVSVSGVGPIDGATGTVSGYEIHTGRTSHIEETARPLEERSAATASVLGTYLHGIFENELIREAFVENVFSSVTVERPATTGTTDAPYAAAAELVAPICLSEFTDEIARL